MQDFISEIYTYSQIPSAFREIISDAYSDRGKLIKPNWDSLQDILSSFIEKTAEQDPQLADEIFEIIKDACKHTLSEPQQISLFADRLEESIPQLYKALSLLGSIDVEENGYHFLSSKSGFLTLIDVATSKYLHSTTDPLWEGHEMAKNVYDYKYTSVKLLGCSLGYLPYQIFAQSDCSCDIYIYHTNKLLVDYAFEYGVLSWIPEDKLHIIINEDAHQLLSEYANTLPHCMYYALPDVLDHLNPADKRLADKFISLVQTGLSFNSFKTINSYRNIANVPKYIYDFHPVKSTDDWAVIMAGPSLDESLNKIREMADNTILLCASTVLQKLLKNGIIPDCVAVLDPHTRTYGHFDGLTYFDVPLFCSSIANWRFGEYYPGDKYLVPCLADNASKDYFLEKGYEIFDLSSTVATMCLTIAAKFNANRVHMFGIDLSFPLGKSHASGTMDLHSVNTASLPQLPCNGGGMVATSEQFMIYISHVNEIIRSHPKTTFINHSKTGVLFENTKQPDN